MEACWCSQLISLFQWPLTSSHVDISTGPNLHDFEAAIVFVWNRQTLTAEQIAPIATWLMPAPCSALHMHPHSTHESQQSFINNWQYYNHTFTNIKKNKISQTSLIFKSYFFERKWWCLDRWQPRRIRTPCCWEGDCFSLSVSHQQHLSALSKLYRLLCFGP